MVKNKHIIKETFIYFFYLFGFHECLCFFLFFFSVYFVLPLSISIQYRLTSLLFFSIANTYSFPPFFFLSNQTRIKWLSVKSIPLLFVMWVCILTGTSSYFALALLDESHTKSYYCYYCGCLREAKIFVKDTEIVCNKFAKILLHGG